MKIALVSLYFDPNAMAVRLLSSILKRDFPDDSISILLLSHKAKPPRMDFDLETPEDLKNIQDFFRREQFNAVGISLMTNYLPRATQLSQAIREVSDARILWGGIHATLRPDECVRHADIVFVGEAEKSLPDVIRRIKNNQSLNEVKGIRFREAGAICGAGAGPTCDDLNSLPPPDYDFTTQFMYSPGDGCVIPMDCGLLVKSAFPFFGGTPFHRIMTARGCAQACSYCINSRYRSILGLKHGLRERSLDSVMSELKMVVALGVFKRLSFVDDDICLRTEKWLQEFSDAYRKDIGLPFYCNATPPKVTPEKIRSLKAAGMTAIGLGVQTGSDRLNREIYNRRVRRMDVVRASEIIGKEAPRVTQMFDFLVRSPFETLQDKIETARLLLQINAHFLVNAYSLTLFPGLPITERAEKEGLKQSDYAYSMTDYDAPEVERRWQEFLESVGKIPFVARQVLLERLDRDAPDNVEALMGILPGRQEVA